MNYNNNFFPSINSLKNTINSYKKRKVYKDFFQQTIKMLIKPPNNLIKNNKIKKL